MNSQTIIGLLVPMCGIVLGSAAVFFMRGEIPQRVLKALLGFASGVMISASMWSLLLPAVTMCEGMGKQAVLPAVCGFLCGMGLLLLLDYAIPHLHPNSQGGPEGPPAHLSRTTMLTLAVTLHHLPEGMAIGVVLAGAMDAGAHVSMAAALALSAGIAIQNVPEGAIVSMPLRAAGNSRWRSFVMGVLSGVIQPVGAILVILLAQRVIPLMPYLLSGAAGAMLYVVIEELIPEASEGTHSNLTPIGFALGFSLMMLLDMTLA